jgi:hypothetical protein
MDIDPKALDHAAQALTAVVPDIVPVTAQPLARAVVEAYLKALEWQEPSLHDFFLGD